MTATQACPFCNQPVALSGVPGRRLTCSECGETFAPRVSEVAQTVGAVSSDSSAAPNAASAPEIDRYLGRAPETRQRNRRVAVVVLAIMVIMAGAGLALALWTQPWRRANDSGLPGQTKNSQSGVEASPVPPGPLAASQMPLLGYVPDGTNLLLGVHNVEMRDDPAASELLHKEVRVAGRTLPLDLTSWLKLDADDVDYTLITATLSRNLVEFRLAILVRTHRPMDETQIVQRLGATREATTDTWNFRPETLKWDVALRFVNKRTLALGIFPEHVKAIPSEPQDGLDHLSAGLGEILPRIEPGGTVWAAAELDPRARDLIISQFARVDRTKFRSVQRLAVWLRPGAPVILSASFCCEDQGSAEALGAYLADLDPDLGPPDLTFAIARNWLDVQRRVKLETLDRWLSHRGP
jgi:hypothetical protein